MKNVIRNLLYILGWTVAGVALSGQPAAASGKAVEAGPAPAAAFLELREKGPTAALAALERALPVGLSPEERERLKLRQAGVLVAEAAARRNKVDAHALSRVVAGEWEARARRLEAGSPEDKRRAGRAWVFAGREYDVLFPDRVKALNAYRKAIEADPENVAARRYLERLEHKQRIMDKRVAYARMLREASGSGKD
ncbi:MAG: hypothetical protein ACFE0O_15460 [Opitutales bacterium]